MVEIIGGRRAYNGVDLRCIRLGCGAYWQQKWFQLEWSKVGVAAEINIAIKEMIYTNRASSGNMGLYVGVGK